MQPTVSDGIVLVYNYAVVLSGWVLVTQVGIQDRLTLLVVSAAIAVGWTIYFRVGMTPKLAARIGDGSEE